MLPQQRCPLCRGERRTRRYRDEELFWIADCDSCAVPMVVYRPHGMPSREEEAVMLRALEEVANHIFGRNGQERRWTLDPVRRRIPDHWHAHARPGWGFCW